MPIVSKLQVESARLAVSRGLMLSLGQRGLGEMSAEQLWDTTLNPDTRRLLPVTLGTWTENETMKTMDMLMGKSESGARRDWLEERGNEVEADI